MKKIILIFVALLLLNSCSKDDNIISGKEQGENPTEESTVEGNPTEQNLTFSFDADLMKYQTIIRRYKFNDSGNKMELSKTWDIPTYAKSEIKTPIIIEVRDLVKEILTPINYKNLKYMYFSVGNADGTGEAGVAKPIEATLNNKGYLLISLRGYVNDSNGKAELKHTLVHEFGHVFLEDITQMTINPPSNPDPCLTIANGEGDYCAKANSYFNKYYQKFWSGIIEEYNKDSEAYYNAHKSDFVTGYAAVNYGEDIAESFTFFILKDKPTTNTTGADKKILFFYDFPELVTMRTAMRS